MKSRKRLEHDTEAYFSGMSDDAANEESALAERLYAATREVDFDEDDAARLVVTRPANPDLQ